MHRPGANSLTKLAIVDRLAKQQCLFQRDLEKIEFIHNGELQRYFK